MKRNSGFTLIELLIVVAILGILGAILFVAIGGNPQRDARDSNRLTTVSQLQLALELYKNANGNYPQTFAGLAPTYIGKAPTDPKTGVAYSYGVDANPANSYHVGAILENEANKALCTDADFDSATPGWTGGFDANGVAVNIFCGGVANGDTAYAADAQPIYDVRS